MRISGRAGAAPALEPQEAYPPARSTASGGYTAIGTASVPCEKDSERLEKHHKCQSRDSDRNVRHRPSAVRLPIRDDCQNNSQHGCDHADPILVAEQRWTQDCKRELVPGD